MKKYSEFLGEKQESSRIYDQLKIPVETPNFSGHAHIKFTKELGKRGNHEYRISYSGTAKNGLITREINPNTHTHRMIVYNADDGTPYKHQIENTSSKTLNDLLHKRAPVLITPKDL